MRVLAWTVLFVVFVSAGKLQWIEAYAAQEASSANHSSQVGSKSSNSQQSSQEKEAQAHYRVALVALKNNDLTTAEDELKQAAQLVPKNALVLYRLAVVQSKRDESQDALSNLQSALRLGLPADVKGPADDLLAELTYSVKKKTDQQAKIDKLAWLAGAWEYSKHRNLMTTRCANNYDQSDSSIALNPDQENGILVGTLRFSYAMDNDVFGPATCNVLTKRRELTLIYNVTVKLSEGIYGFVIEGVFVSCSGNYCNDVNKGNSFSYIEKEEYGFQVKSIFIPYPANNAGHLEFHRSN